MPPPGAAGSGQAELFPDAREERHRRVARATDAVRDAVAETRRRQTRQREYNQRHGIVPRTIAKRIADEIIATVNTSVASRTLFSRMNATSIPTMPESRNGDRL